MKKIGLFLILLLMFTACSSTQTGNSKKKYFDADNQEIERKEFLELKKQRSFMEFPSENPRNRKLFRIETEGEIKNIQYIRDLLAKEYNFSQKASAPLVVIYYREKDPCNSSGGFVNKEWMREYKKQLEEGLSKIANIQTMYLYKEYDGLEIHKNLIPWQKDPSNFFYESFFNGYFACTGFVVIAEDGRYFSRSVEFNKELVFEVAKALN